MVDVCCLSGKGIEALKDAIKELVWAGEIQAEMLQVMINSRHQEALDARARRGEKGRWRRCAPARRWNWSPWICASP